MFLMPAVLFLDGFLVCAGLWGCERDRCLMSWGAHCFWEAAVGMGGYPCAGLGLTLPVGRSGSSPPPAAPAPTAEAKISERSCCEMGRGWQRVPLHPSVILPWEC